QKTEIVVRTRINYRGRIREQEKRTVIPTVTVKKNYTLALLSAFLLWLAWPPFSYTSPLLWVAFVPLLLALETVMRGDYRRKGSKIFLLGGLTALLWNTASIYWVFNAMNAIMPVYAAALVSLIPFGLAGLLLAFAFRLY